MITDCGSFLVEYLPTRNPVIQLMRPDAEPHNPLMQKVSAHYYKVDNAADLEQKLVDILAGKDELYAARQADLAACNFGGASQNIISVLHLLIR
jgi:hypothetical protein